LLGVGLSIFVEPTAYGTRSFGARKMQMVPGYEQATVRVDPTGSVLVMAGTHSHGQGHATTYAQIVADQLGVPPERIHVREGDTDLVPHGWGTFASRSIVSAGGAIQKATAAVLDEMRAIAAHLLEASVEDIELHEGRLGVRGSAASAITVEEIARVAHHAADRLPPGLGRGLEATADFDPDGTYSNAAHCAVVEVDPETGEVQLVRFVVVEDCGVMINPMVVEGQVAGGVVQGVGSALLEQLVHDAEGQPLTTSLMDYLVPTATDVPAIDIHHLVTPTTRSATGAKGMGEGGTIGAPAAILNAVNDALSGRGRVTRLPIRPADVLAAIGAGPQPGDTPTQVFAPLGASTLEVTT
jgi:carbon-monoxide dehydrogenase large subunit